MAKNNVFEFETESGTKDAIVLKPVSPLKLKELFRISKKMGSVDDPTAAMDDSVIEDMITLCTETMDRSCPSWNKEQKDTFITTHFSALITKVFEVNSPSNK